MSRAKNRLAALVVALVLFGVAWMPKWVMAESSSPSVTLDASASTPRRLEETTVQAISRDYSAAWKNLALALKQSRADLLNASFVGTARERFTELIASQKKNGLHQRYVDRGHKVQVLFYSPDGSSMQVRDTAQIEIQLLDGDTVLSSEETTTTFVALLTPAENSWKIRVLEQVPSFQ